MPEFRRPEICQTQSPCNPAFFPVLLLCIVLEFSSKAQVNSLDLKMEPFVLTAADVRIPKTSPSFHALLSSIWLKGPALCSSKINFRSYRIKSNKCKMNRWNHLRYTDVQRKVLSCFSLDSRSAVHAMRGGYGFMGDRMKILFGPVNYFSTCNQRQNIYCGSQLFRGRKVLL